MARPDQFKRVAGGGTTLAREKHGISTKIAGILLSRSHGDELWLCASVAERVVATLYSERNIHFYLH